MKLKDKAKGARRPRNNRRPLPEELMMDAKHKREYYNCAGSFALNGRSIVRVDCYRVIARPQPVAVRIVSSLLPEEKLPDEYLIDFRVWYKAGVKWLPSRKGIRFPMKFLEDLLPRLQTLLTYQQQVKAGERRTLHLKRAHNLVIGDSKVPAK